MTHVKAPSPAETAALFQALADENRVRVVEALRGGERCVCELQDELGLSQSLLSHHLSVLRRSGLVAARRDGRWAHYSITAPELRALGEYVDALATDANRTPTPSSCDVSP